MLLNQENLTTSELLPTVSVPTPSHCMWAVCHAIAFAKLWHFT